MSAGHERRVVRRAVDGHLDRQHVGVGHGLLDEALHARGERVVRVVDEDVPAAHRPEHVALAVLPGCRRGCVTGRPRRVAQLVEARELDDGPQVLQVEHPLDLVDLPRLDPERGGQRLAQAGRHARVELHADHLAEAPAAQLGLHGAQEVVGLVGDLEVRVAGDPEDPVSRISMPGKSVSRWASMSSSRGTKTWPSPVTGTSRGRISFGTLTRANMLWPFTGSRTRTARLSERLEM
jgi:hypothetical protein